MKILLTIFILLFYNLSYSQCSTANTICQPGVAGPFALINNGGASVSTCLNYMGSSQYGFIVLYINLKDHSVLLARI